VTQSRISLGAGGEEAALALYLKRGYRLAARNWRCGIGEIDLVLMRGDTLVFCEVKSRRGGLYGAGHEAVTARKQAKLRSLAQVFLLSNPLSPPHARSMRFDVASVSCEPDGSVSSVEVFEDAF
jgi:putative endonuclease